MEKVIHDCLNGDQNQEKHIELDTFSKMLCARVKKVPKLTPFDLLLFLMRNFYSIAEGENDSLGDNL